jgi:hypothetical protein
MEVNPLRIKGNGCPFTTQIDMNLNSGGNAVRLQTSHFRFITPGNGPELPMPVAAKIYLTLIWAYF